MCEESQFSACRTREGVERERGAWFLSYQEVRMGASGSQQEQPDFESERAHALDDPRSLLTKWWDQTFTKRLQPRTQMLGLDAAGKTSIMYKMKLGDKIDTIPTIGFNCETIEYRGHSITLWDVGGQDKIRRLWRRHLEGTSAVIWVMDSADRERMAEVRDELHKLMSESELASAILLVYANKQDLEAACSAAELTEQLELHRLTQRRWHVQPCSATTGVGLYAGVRWYVEQVTVAARTGESSKAAAALQQQK